MSRLQLMAYDTLRRRELENQTPSQPPLPPEFTLPAEAVLERAGEMELLAAVLVRDLFVQESFLALASCSEYSFMGPLERTELFVAKYKVAFSSEFRMACDISADLASPNFPVVWQMRQSADRTGLPYEVYCEIAMQLYRAPQYLDRLKSGTLLIPRRVESITWFRAKQRLWREFERSSQVRATFVPQYHVEHFKQLPAQVRFRNKLVEYAERTGHVETVAFNAYLQRYIIPIGELLNSLRLESEEVRRVIESLKSQVGDFGTRPPGETLPPKAFMQGCFGWFKASRNDCVRCPLRTQCASLAGKFKLSEP